MKVILALCVFFVSFSLYTEENPPFKIVYFTTPKGGSHLIKKVLDLITERPFRTLPPLHSKPFPDFLNPSNPCIAYHHLENGYERILEDATGSFIKLVMVRDPRDVIVSMAAWIEVMADTESAREFSRLSLEEQITLLITAPDLSMNGRHPYVFDTHFIVQCALQWMAHPEVLVCRFEDLVGAKGGGSQLRQLSAVKALAEHLRYDLSSEQIENVAENIFGETVTFRLGQIGSWRQVFTPQHKKIFKARMGQELIQLGYETDDAW